MIKNVIKMVSETCPGPYFKLLQTAGNLQVTRDDRTTIRRVRGQRPKPSFVVAFKLLTAILLVFGRQTLPFQRWSDRKGPIDQYLELRAHTTQRFDHLAANRFRWSARTAATARLKPAGLDQFARRRL